jgi:hypothetical protein
MWNGKSCARLPMGRRPSHLLESAPLGSGAEARPLAGPVVPLTISTGGGDELLGSERGPRPAAPDPLVARVLSRGEALDPQRGRADDFMLRLVVPATLGDPERSRTDSPVTVATALTTPCLAANNARRPKVKLQRSAASLYSPMAAVVIVSPARSATGLAGEGKVATSRASPASLRQGAAGADATLTSLGYFPPLSKAINARKRTGSARQPAMVA